MRFVLALLLSGFAMAFANPRANAAIITFGGLATPGTFTTYTEAGFQVAPTAGSWSKNTFSVGNPLPSIFGLSASATIEVTSLTPGGLFTFQGIDLADALLGTAGVSYTLVGERLGATQFSVSGGPIAGGFTTIASPNSTVNLDLLRVTVTTTLPNQSSGPYNVDNIQVTPAAAVPEPCSIAVFGGLLGLGGLVASRRTRVA